MNSQFLSASGLKLDCTLDKMTFTVLAFYRYHEYLESIFINELNLFIFELDKNKLVILAENINLKLLSESNIIDEYNFMLSSYGSSYL